MPKDYLDVRSQILANCKCLYGLNTEVLTLSYGARCQAIAMRFDPATKSGTKYLHAQDAASTNLALQKLLQETELALAELFSASGVSFPFSGSPVQTIALRGKGQSHAGPGSSVGSDSSAFEVVTTPASTLLEGTEVALDDDNELVELEAETKLKMCQDWQLETLGAEEAPYNLPDVVFEEQWRVDYGKAIACEEYIPCEQSIPCEEAIPREEATSYEEAIPCEKLITSEEPVICGEPIASNESVGYYEPAVYDQPVASEEKPKKKEKSERKAKRELKMNEKRLKKEKTKKKKEKEKKGAYEEEEDRIISEDLPRSIETAYEPGDPIFGYEPVVERNKSVEDTPRIEKSDIEAEIADVDNNFLSFHALV